MTLKLIATDMDGTLLTDADKSFDRDHFDRLLTRMNSAGVKFVIASGNQLEKLRQYMTGFTNRGITYIAENGGYIADDVEGDILVSGFSTAIVHEIMDVLDGFPSVGYIVSAHSGAYLLEDRAEPITQLIREHLDFMGAEFPRELDYKTFINRFYPGTQVIQSPAEIQDTVIKFALQTRRRDLDTVLKQLIEVLPRQVVPVASGFGSIDLVSRGVNKGSALKWFCEREGIDTSEMLAFGDNSNDLEMLTLAGEGVAVSNAIPAVRAAADTVIGSNEQGAVLHYIEQKLDEMGA